MLARTGAPPYGDDGSAIVVFPMAVAPDRIDPYWKVGHRRHTGTHTGYVNLITGAGPTPELLLEARKPSPDELKLAADRKVELVIRPVALDGFVFLTNAANPVTGLTLTQVRAIYTGQVANWKGLGGHDEPILAFVRDRNSGSEELMRKLVMAGQPTVGGEDMMLTTMMGPIERISRTPNAIGYSLFYYEQTMAPNARNRLLAIDGVAPTRATIAKRQYPLTTEVYLVTRGDLKPERPAAKLAAWLLTADGQRAVAASGYVPLSAVNAAS
jgi:phosphate transport system substrate-binding protein